MQELLLSRILEPSTPLHPRIQDDGFSKQNVWLIKCLYCFNISLELPIGYSPFVEINFMTPRSSKMIYKCITK